MQQSRQKVHQSWCFLQRCCHDITGKCYPQSYFLSDKVTEEKGGFDFEVASFNEQFPDYYNDIYVYNRNLKIDDAYQNIAYINRENEIHFNVNLPEEEKAKVLELRDKKEILSAPVLLKDLLIYFFHLK